MFLEGLKFALGLIAGLCVFSGMSVLALVGVELFALWRRKRLCRMYAAQAHALKHVLPPIMEHAIFCFRFCSDDWLSIHEKNERLPRDF